MVDTKIKNCLACHATTYGPTCEPLKPTKLPDCPWQCIDMNFWGPLPNGEYTCLWWPDTQKKSSPRTPVLKLWSHTLVVSSQHTGFSDSVKTDRGPLFNGSDSHEYQMYMKWAGVKTIVVPEDPEANGLAENIMKPLSEVWCTSHIEGKNAKQDIQIPATLQGNKHHTQPLAKPQPSSCSSASTQCTFQSYRSQYMTPKYTNKMHKPKQSKRLTMIPKQMLITTTSRAGLFESRLTLTQG